MQPPIDDDALRGLAAANAGTPLRRIFTGMIGACILPLLAIATWLAWTRIRDLDAARHDVATRLVHDLASTIDHQLVERIHGLELLATSPLLGDPGAREALYQEALEFQRSFGSHVILAAVTGADQPMPMLLNTRVPFGTPLPNLPIPAGRASAPEAVATGRPAVGDSFLGPVAQKRLVAISVPVRREGKTRYVLVTTVETDRFQARFDHLAVPAGWVLELRDGIGAVLARQAPDRQELAVGAAAPVHIEVRSTLSPWTVTLTISRSEHERAVLESALLIGLALLAATAAGALGGALLARRVGRAVSSLPAPHDLAGARRFAGGDPEIAEIATVRHALAQSAAQREASEALFRRLFKEAPMPMAHVDPTGRIAARNAAFLQVIGYSAEQVPTIAEWWERAYPDPRYRAEVLASWGTASAQSAATGENIAPGEYRVTCKDGRERTMRITGIRIAGGVLASFEDLTEQRAAERDLRLWASAFEHARIGVAITDATTGRLTAVNPAFAEERGYSPEDLVGQPIFTVFPPDRHDELRRRIAAVHESGHDTFEAEHLSRDGRRFPVLIDLTAVRDSAGRPLVRIAYVFDLTERKRVERELHEAQAAVLEEQRRTHAAVLEQMRESNAARAAAEAALAALRESEERLGLFIEHAPAALAMFDRQMRYLAASRRWRADFSLGDTPLLGRSHYEIFPEISADWRAIHHRSLAGEVVRSDGDRFERSDGSRHWLRWETRPWFAHDGTVGGILIFSEDITRQKEAETEILRLNADLERRVEQRTAELTEANRELDAFAYAVSHDLRAPLRTMGGFAQILGEEIGAGPPDGRHEEMRVCLRHIETSIGRMNGLIDGLLELSRETRGEMRRERVDLTAIARRRIEELRAAEPDRRVECEIEPALVAVGDPRMLESLIVNLVDNAWKYSGKETLARLRFVGAELDGIPGFAVHDNGVGFDMAHAARLFEPLQRLHRDDEFPGNGLGLATARRIVQRHGGRIVARSQPGRGATFLFTLPAVKSSG